jgi:hypothetical protein
MNLLASCTQDNSNDNNPSYLSANIGSVSWSANSVSIGQDTTGYSYLEADNSDGSLFYLSYPTSGSGNYSVASNGDCSVEYIDSLGDSYSIQGGSMNLNSPLFGRTSGSFGGLGVNDFNSQDQVNISGSFSE